MLKANIVMPYMYAPSAFWRFQYHAQTGQNPKWQKHKKTCWPLLPLSGQWSRRPPGNQMPLIALPQVWHGKRCGKWWEDLSTWQEQRPHWQPEISMHLHSVSSSHRMRWVVTMTKNNIPVWNDWNFIRINSFYTNNQQWLSVDMARMHTQMHEWKCPYTHTHTHTDDLKSVVIIFILIFF